VDNDGSTSDLESTEDREETAASFLEFIEKARNGEFLPPEVIVKYAKYFKDELTLDNMPRMQLINMCRYMAIPPYGNDNVLRFQLRHKIRGLIEDDQRILWEGIGSLTKMELREACAERGMRSTGLSKEAYTRSLQQWIDLSVNRNVPISLLIMSRTFFLQEEMTSHPSAAGDDSKSVTGLADAISGLDKEIVNEVILQSLTADQKHNDADVMKLKLEVLEQQNELIEEEKQQRDAEVAKVEAAKAEKEKAEKEKAEKEKAEQMQIDVGTDETTAKPESAVSDSIVPKEAFTTYDAETKTVEPKKTEDVGSAASATEEDTEKEEEETSLSSEEIDAISQLVSPDPVSAERSKLESIKAALLEKEEEEKEAERDGAVETLKDSSEAITVETADKIAQEQILAMDEQAKVESEASTQISMDGKIEKTDDEPSEEIEDDEDKRLDQAVSRLKSKIESMLGKLDLQLSDVEAKIGNKLHFLDKDMDGILSREEMAKCLQTVLKRNLSFDEAMAIAADMVSNYYILRNQIKLFLPPHSNDPSFHQFTKDENEDGLFSMEELSKWLETNKLVKLVEEGRDAEVDKIIESQAAKMKEENDKK